MKKLEKYQVFIKKRAEKEMDHLSEKNFTRVAEAIISLERNPRPKNCKKLRGIEEYRLRVGVFRILYTVNDRDKKVIIIAVRHRSEIYKNI